MPLTPLPKRLVACASVIAASLTLLTARITHPGIGPDAVAYIAVADSIRNGTGIGFWLEDPLVTWPPLWPLSIAAGSWLTGWRSDVVGLVLNSALVAGTVVAASQVARRILRSQRLLTVFVISLAVSPPLVGLAVLVQTEISLALVVLLVTWFIMLHSERGQARWLAAAGLATAAGFYARYQAIYIVPVFAGWLVLRALLGPGDTRSGDRTRSVLRLSARTRTALSDAAAYSLPAVVLSGIWILRNVSLGEPPVGPRFPSDVGPLWNTVNALTTTFKFVTSIPSPPRLPAAIVTLVCATVAGVWLVRRTSDHPATATPRERAISSLLGWPGMLTTFVAGFTALMVISRSVVGFDDLDIRLLAPCLIPTSILLLRYVEITFGTPAGLRTVGKWLVGIWLAAQVTVCFALVGPANDMVTDYGFNAPRAVAASRSSAIDALPAGCVAYSNNAGDLYRSGFEANLSPSTVEYKSSQPTDDLEQLTVRVNEGEAACLVWVEYSEDPKQYSLEEIEEVLRLDELASADGVTTYRILPR